MPAARRTYSNHRHRHAGYHGQPRRDQTLIVLAVAVLAVMAVSLGALTSLFRP